MTTTEPDTKADAIAELEVLKQERIKHKQATDELRARTIAACQRAAEAGLSAKTIAALVGFQSRQQATNYINGKTY